MHKFNMSTFKTHKTALMITLFGMLLFIVPSILMAAVDSQDTIHLDGLTVSRPSDRWRVVENINSDLVNFKYLRRGADVVIRIYKNQPFISKSHIKKSEYRNNYSSIRTRLLRPFEKQGFRFIDFQKDEHTAFALGVDSEQRYLMLKFFFCESDFSNDYFVIETLLENQDYLVFRNDVYQVMKSVSITPNQP
ncbi:MAG: hypothetical protein HQM16_12945 [Deltaproteobacteria bacterium]|nr:hypothetical protein [Deltaproteobacteria bacterium]